MVEDLITDGLSKLRFNIGVRGAGAKMTHCLCVFDYASDRLNQHEGRDSLAKNGIDCMFSPIGMTYWTPGRAKTILRRNRMRRLSTF